MPFKTLEHPSINNHLPIFTNNFLVPSIHGNGESDEALILSHFSYMYVLDTSSQMLGVHAVCRVSQINLKLEKEKTKWNKFGCLTNIPKLDY